MFLIKKRVLEVAYVFRLSWCAEYSQHDSHLDDCVYLDVYTEITKLVGEDGNREGKVGILTNFIDKWDDLKELFIN